MPDLATFCFPDGLRLYTHARPAEVFHMVFTGADGMKQYCTFLRTYEPQRTFELASRFLSTGAPGWVRQSVYYLPQAVAIVSRFGFLTAFRRILSQLLRLSLSSFVPVERVLAALMTQVPVPPRGRCSVGFTIGDEHFVLSRPPPRALPLFDVPMSHLFHCLDVNNVLLVRLLLSVGEGCTRLQRSRRPGLQ